MTLPSLPNAPADWVGDDGSDFKVLGKLSESTLRSIEPVGPNFLAHARRARHKRTFSEDDRIQAQESAKKVEENDDSDMSEPETPELLMRDPKDWKVCPDWWTGVGGTETPMPATVLLAPSNETRSPR